MHAVVHPADIQDRDGGVLVLATMFGLFPFVKTLFADGGYQGPHFRQQLAKVLPQLSVEIVKRSDTAQGFEVLPRRWVVERTLAWLNRCRRLAKDFENRTRTALAFLKLASIRLMLRKLSKSVYTFRTNSKVAQPIVGRDCYQWHLSASQKPRTRLAGKDKVTIHRAMKSGRLSYSIGPGGERQIDVAELERVLSIKSSEVAPGNPRVTGSNHAQLATQLDVERIRTAILQERLADQREVIDDLRRRLDEEAGSGDALQRNSVHY